MQISLVLGLAATLLAQAPALQVQPRARAFTLETASVGGGSVVRVGDHVDVLAVMQDPESKRLVGVTLLQNVIVVGNSAPAPGEPRQLSLLLIPEEAQLIAVARDAGHLSVTLRNPADVEVLEERDLATISSILQGKLVPQPKSPRK